MNYLAVLVMLVAMVIFDLLMFVFVLHFIKQMTHLFEADVFRWGALERYVRTSVRTFLFCLDTHRTRIDTSATRDRGPHTREHAHKETYCSRAHGPRSLGSRQTY